MSIFWWRIVGLFGLLFFMIFVTNIIITLLLVDDLKNQEIGGNWKILFVQIVNWAYAGLLMLTTLIGFMTLPIMVRYLRSSSAMDRKFGLHPAHQEKDD